MSKRNKGIHRTGVHIDTKELEEKFKKAGRAMAKRINAFIVSSAVKTYIPYGSTGNLAKSLREKVGLKDGKISLSVSAEVDYAKKIHDTNLRHANQPSERSSFMSFGTGSTDKEKYWSGHSAMAHTSPKYATKFLEKPLQFVMGNLSEFLDTFKRYFNG